MGRALVVMLFLQLPGLVSAQGPAHFGSGRIVHVGRDAYRVVQRWNGRSGSIVISGPSFEREIALPAPGLMSAAASADAIAIAVASGEPAVRTILVPLRTRREEWRLVDRPGGRELSPVGIAVFARPDGFGVWWQEASVANVNDLWRTFEVRIDGSGSLGGARELAGMRWPMLDAAYVEAGSTFALLLYGGGDPTGSRLCAVRISDEGSSLEHPWWASRAGLITEGQLVVSSGRVFAVYRGGSGGTTLLDNEVTTGQWGQEGPEPRAHGNIGTREIFGARPDGPRVHVERAAMR